MAGHSFSHGNSLKETNNDTCSTSITAPSRDLEPLATSIISTAIIPRTSDSIHSAHLAVITPWTAALELRQNNPQDVSNAIDAAVNRATVEMSRTIIRLNATFSQQLKAASSSASAGISSANSSAISTINFVMRSADVVTLSALANVTSAQLALMNATISLSSALSDVTSVSAASSSDASRLSSSLTLLQASLVSAQASTTTLTIQPGATLAPDINPTIAQTGPTTIMLGGRVVTVAQATVIAVVAIFISILVNSVICWWILRMKKRNAAKSYPDDKDFPGTPKNRTSQISLIIRSKIETVPNLAVALPTGSSAGDPLQYLPSTASSPAMQSKSISSELSLKRISNIEYSLASIHKNLDILSSPPITTPTNAEFIDEYSSRAEKGALATEARVASSRLQKIQQAARDMAQIQTELEEKEEEKKAMAAKKEVEALAMFVKEAAEQKRQEEIQIEEARLAAIAAARVEQERLEAEALTADENRLMVEAKEISKIEAEGKILRGEADCQRLVPQAEMELRSIAEKKKLRTGVEEGINFEAREKPGAETKLEKLQYKAEDHHRTEEKKRRLEMEAEARVRIALEGERLRLEAEKERLSLQAKKEEARLEEERRLITVEAAEKLRIEVEKERLSLRAKEEEAKLEEEKRLIIAEVTEKLRIEAEEKRLRMEAENFATNHSERGRSITRTSDLIEARESAKQQRVKDISPLMRNPVLAELIPDLFERTMSPLRRNPTYPSDARRRSKTLQPHRRKASDASALRRSRTISPLQRNPYQPGDNPLPRTRPPQQPKASSSHTLSQRNPILKKPKPNAQFSSVLSKFSYLASQSPEISDARNEVNQRAIMGIYIPGSLREKAVRNVSKSRERGERKKRDN